MSTRTVIITDPSFVKNASEYAANINAPAKSASRVPGNYVALRVTLGLFESLKLSNNFERSSDTNDELFYSFGRTEPLAKYRLLGVHGSDSGMTCLIDADPFQHPTTTEDGIVKNEAASPLLPEDLEVDWSDFVLTTLEDPDTQVDAEAFPLYRFFGKIPEEDSAVAVFGVEASNQPDVYDGIVLRSRDLALENLDNDEEISNE